MRECNWFQVCPLKRYTERGVLPEHWIEEYCRGDWNRCARYRMEERGEWHPARMLPDGSLGCDLEDR